MKDNSFERKGLSSRASFMDKLEIPKSSQECIIIPSNKTGLGFLRKQYKYDYLHKYISEEDFNKVVEQITRLAQIAYSEKRSIDNKQLSPRVFYTTFFCLALVLAFFFTSYWAALQNSASLRIISVLLLVLAILIESMVTFAVIFARMPNYPDLDTLVKNKLDVYFDKINAQHVKKGFYWRAVPHHYWIELRIENEDIDPMDVRRRKLKKEKERIEQKKKDDANQKKEKQIPNFEPKGVPKMEEDPNQKGNMSKDLKKPEEGTPIDQESNVNDESSMRINDILEVLDDEEGKADEKQEEL